jgi:hypothetical protein
MSNPEKVWCCNCGGMVWTHDVTGLCLWCGRDPRDRKPKPKSEPSPPSDEPGFL